MNKKFICLLWLCLPLFCMAQSGLSFVYEYDNAGNRVVRKMIIAKSTPLTSSDSTITNDDFQVTGDDALSAEYFVEKIAQVEINIYPNPATEKITLTIANMENLRQGVFKLYSLTGQLLQECQVHSATTEVSLAGLACGTYLLKIRINDRTEDWKIIKQ